MSQELLIFNFITLELFALVALYNFVIIPMNAKATISRWESKMLEGDFDTVAMLDQYTEHLMGEFSIFLRKFFASAAGNAAKSIGKTEEGTQLNLVQSMMSNLQNEEWYIQALAPRLLGLLENAGAPGETVVEAIKTAYNPGLDRR